MRQTLEELSESLDETYERIVMEIKKAHKAHAFRMLQCLAVAVRPLTVAELAELLAFDFNAAKGGIPKLNTDWRWEDHEQAVLSICSSLITVVGSGVVQFSHFSVKEFLLSDRLAMLTDDISCYRIVPEDANIVLAQACLGVLLHDENGHDIIPLAQYAARYWVTHAQVKNVASRIREGMEYLFDPDKPYFSAWVRLHDLDRHRWPSRLRNRLEPGVPPLYYAAFCGFHQIVENLALRYPQHVNTICGSGGTALHAAAHAGHVSVVRSLLKALKCGMDVDARGTGNQSPLQFASFRGHLDVVRCLLDHGADAKFQDDNLWTPLGHAAHQGYPDTARVLLEDEADANSRDKQGLTPLHKAFSFSFGNFKGEYSEVVQLLLEHGANPNARDNKRRTPLHLASSSRLDAAHVLFTHGADVDARDEEGRTPLQAASARGQDTIVQLLSSEYRPSRAQMPGHDQVESKII